MSHVLELTDEQYETLLKAAERDNQTPEQLIGRMVAALADAQGTVYFTDDELLRALGAGDDELAELAKLERQTGIETEDWFRHLGVSEERIQRAQERAERDADA
ncbi:MAG: hypothetical protein OJF49_002907 [Ktedonobacterales bacterium]|jgi:hypothetical protein|nr:MAG: hypothetical protein OJF49_002907 [Ktedonobacterales bacterium]